MRAKNTSIYSIASKPCVFPFFLWIIPIEPKIERNQSIILRKYTRAKAILPIFPQKTRLPEPKTQWENMETPVPVALNVAPLNAPHKELEWLPLADKDLQINELIG